MGASRRSNWLSQGFHIADRLGYVLLPKGLPDYLDMPDDPPEPGNDLNAEDVSTLRRLRAASRMEQKDIAPRAGKPPMNADERG